MDFKKTVFNLELMAIDADCDADMCRQEALKAHTRMTKAVKELENLIEEFNEKVRVRNEAKEDYRANIKLMEGFRTTASEYRKAADILKAASD